MVWREGSPVSKPAVCRSSSLRSEKSDRKVSFNIPKGAKKGRNFFSRLKGAASKESSPAPQQESEYSCRTPKARSRDSSPLLQDTDQDFTRGRRPISNDSTNPPDHEQDSGRISRARSSSRDPILQDTRRNSSKDPISLLQESELEGQRYHKGKGAIPAPLEEWQAEDLVRAVDTVRCGVTRNDSARNRERESASRHARQSNLVKIQNFNKTAKNTNLERRARNNELSSNSNLNVMRNNSRNGHGGKRNNTNNNNNNNNYNNNNKHSFLHSNSNSNRQPLTDTRANNKIEKMIRKFDARDSGFTDTRGGYDDTRRGYADTRGDYVARENYADTRESYTETRRGYTDSRGSYLSRDEYADTRENYADTPGGYRDSRGDYADTRGGYLARDDYADTRDKYEVRPRESYGHARDTSYENRRKSYEDSMGSYVRTSSPVRYSNTLPKSPSAYNNHNNNRPFSYTNSQRIVNMETIRRLSPPPDAQGKNLNSNPNDFSAKIIITDSADDDDDDYETFQVTGKTVTDSKMERTVKNSKYVTEKTAKSSKYLMDETAKNSKYITDKSAKNLNSKYLTEKTVTNSNPNMAVSSIGVQTDQSQTRSRTRTKTSNLGPQFQDKRFTNTPMTSATLVREINRGFGRYNRSPSPVTVKVHPEPQKPVKNSKKSSYVVPLLSDTEFEFEYEGDPLARIRRQVTERERIQELHEYAENNGRADEYAGNNRADDYPGSNNRADDGYPGNNIHADEYAENNGRADNRRMMRTYAADKELKMTPLTLDEVEALSLVVEAQDLKVTDKTDKADRTDTSKKKKKKKIKFFHKTPADDEERMKKFQEYRGREEEEEKEKEEEEEEEEEERGKHKEEQVEEKKFVSKEGVKKVEKEPTTATRKSRERPRRISQSQSFSSSSQPITRRESPSGPPRQGMKPLKPRYFGDTDTEELFPATTTTATTTNTPAPAKQGYQSLPNRVAAKTRARSGKMARNRLRGRSSSNSRNSSESEVDSKASHVSTGSNRSVYLHTPAIADIPVRGEREREREKGERERETQRRKVTRSFSLLSPWKPRHREREREIDYDRKTALPPRPPRRPPPPAATTNPAPPTTTTTTGKSSKLSTWLRKKRNKEAKGI